MINKLGWKIGGEQGEGLESTAEIFSTVINTLGYHMYSTRDFASRIKGGHSNSKICISEERINVIEDAKIKPEISEEIKGLVAVFPITDLAKEIANPIIKNIITLGICSALLDIASIIS